VLYRGVWWWGFNVCFQKLCLKIDKKNFSHKKAGLFYNNYIHQKVFYYFPTAPAAAPTPTPPSQTQTHHQNQQQQFVNNSNKNFLI